MPCIYFITKGAVELYLEANNKRKIKLKVLHENEYFGEEDFFSCQYMHFVGAASVGVTHIIKLELDSFMDVL